MKLSTLKHLYEMFMEYDVGKQKSDTSAVTYRVIGCVEFQTDVEKVKKLDFALLLGEYERDPGALIETKGGYKFIGMGVKIFMSVPWYKIVATVAHEVGHYLDPEIASDDAKLLTERTSKLKLLKNLFNSEQNPLKSLPIYKRFNTATLTSLLRGGVLKQEIAADLIAVRYVHVNDLILTHMDDLSADNPFVRIEKQNRINFLSQLPITGDEKLLKLSVVINKPKKS